MEQMMLFQFGAYVALAFVLYAIRQAARINKRYLPLTALILGLALASFQEKTFNFNVFMEGVKYALYGVGTVATIRYFFNRLEE